jgi:hypothetical protein
LTWFSIHPRVFVRSARTAAIAPASFFTLQAVHAQRHSVRTFSSPRSRNRRTPKIALMMAKGVSAMCIRRL